MKTLADYKGQAVQLRTERDRVKQGQWQRELSVVLERVRRTIAEIESTAFASRVIECVVLVGVVRLVMVCG